jgi:polyisoprenoid-binding protein YceI
MKKQAIFLLSLAAIFWVSCQNEPAKTATATTAPPTETSLNVADGLYTVNTANSVIEWVGTKANGSQHAGTIKLQNGELNLFQGNITGGKMVLDMNSIAVTDLEGGEKADLEDHLKNADFFEVDKFPTGGFEFGSTLPLSDDPSGAFHSTCAPKVVKSSWKHLNLPSTG